MTPAFDLIGLDIEWATGEQFPLLQELDAANTVLGGNLTDFAAAFPSLVYLDIYGSQLGGVLPSGMNDVLFSSFAPLAHFGSPRNNTQLISRSVQVHCHAELDRQQT